MLGIARRRETYAYLQQRGSATVAQIAERLDVSLQTVRRDLDALTDEGLVLRVHGGAVALDATTGAAPEGAPHERATLNEAAKRRIGALAAELVQPNTTIFLSGGTTTAQVTPWLHGRERLTVVTNAINVVAGLSRFEEIQVLVLPGTLRHRELTLLGTQAVEAIAQYDIAHAIFGCYGLDPASAVVYGASPGEAAVDRALLQAAQRVTILADHSKFSQRGPMRIAGPEQLTTVVTDSAAAQEDLRALGNHDVEVLTA